MQRLLALLGIFIFLAGTVALAGGGPRNVLVVVNEASEESLEIANHYLHARDIPWSNLCRVTTTTAFTCSQAEYQNEIEQPILDCIAASPNRNWIDYIVLTRGFPIRANFTGGQVSTTALLQVMDTPLRGKPQEASWWAYDNPYAGQNEFFSHSKTFGPGAYHLYVATMLSGYWSEEAKALADRSVASDGNPPTSGGGVFYLEDGAPAADVRNGDFDQAAANLQGQGHQAIHILQADPDVTGSVVASHLNSGSYSGISKAEILSNTFPPGCLVDVFESYGLVPANFDPDQPPSQVPATWWVTGGATTVHGTVFEPFNIAFPDGFMLQPYVAGYNAGETWYQSIPFLYWANLVLGDPLAQPFARNPVITIQSPAPGATVSGQVTLAASATVLGSIQMMRFFLDDAQVYTVNGPAGSTSWNSWNVTDGWHRFEVIAYATGAVYAQGRAAIDVFVRNLALDATITDLPDGTLVGASFPVTVETSPAITSVTLYAEDLGLGTRSGSTPFRADVDTAPLGRGRHSLYAIGDDGSGNRVRSAPVDILVVKEPRIHSQAPTNGPQAGGTAVDFTGWNMEPSIRILFGTNESRTVTWTDANHLSAVTPPGPAGPVDVTLENPAGRTLVLPGAFLYDPGPCPVWNPVTGLRVSRDPDGRLRMAWDPLSDPCLRSYGVLRATDPASPPAFPGDYADITPLDEDGDIGGDPSFLYGFFPGDALTLYEVAGIGTDGTVGPE